MAEIEKEDKDECLLFSLLPEELLIKIIKEYIPLSDKIYTLPKIQQFAEFLQDKSSWCENSHEYAQLACMILPGWHTSKNTPKDVYYVKTCPEILGIVIYHFNSFHVTKKIKPCQRKTAETNPEKIAKILKNFVDTTDPVDEINVYRFKRTYFSIPPSHDRVCWWKRHQTFSMQDNTSFIRTVGEHLKLEFNPVDRTVVLTCLGGHSSNTCICPSKSITLVPLEYRPVCYGSSTNFNTLRKTYIQSRDGKYTLVYCCPSLFETFQTDLVTFQLISPNKIKVTGDIYATRGLIGHINRTYVHKVMSTINRYYI